MHIKCGLECPLLRFKTETYETRTWVWSVSTYFCDCECVLQWAGVPFVENGEQNMLQIEIKLSNTLLSILASRFISKSTDELLNYIMMTPFGPVSAHSQSCWWVSCGLALRLLMHVLAGDNVATCHTSTGQLLGSKVFKQKWKKKKNPAVPPGWSRVPFEF